MTAAPHYDVGEKLTKPQRIWGLVYLPFYLVLLSPILQYGAWFLDIPLTGYSLNLTYFAVNFAVVLLIFHRFLFRSLGGFTRYFWSFIQTLILGFALYYISTLALTWLLHLVAGNVENFNNETVERYIGENARVMLLCTVVVAPVVEETLVRGLVFGSLHPVNRILAYAVSILLFCFMHVGQYITTAGVKDILLAAVIYIPAGAALGWTYEKSHTVWTPIVLHAIINAVSYGAATM